MLPTNNYEDLEIQINLGQWIRTTFGQNWFLYTPYRLEADAKLRQMLNAGCKLFTNYRNNNEIIEFSGFSHTGAANIFIRPYYNVYAHFFAKKLPIYYVDEPCAIRLGGYSKRKREVHQDYYPLDYLSVTGPTQLIESLLDYQD